MEDMYPSLVTILMEKGQSRLGIIKSSIKIIRNHKEQRIKNVRKIHIIE